MYEEMSLLEFQQAFGSEEACLKYLFEKRWPEEFQCPHCGQGEYYFLKKRRLYQCRACGYQASVTAGTIFHKTRTPLRDWFWMIFLMSRQKAGVSMLALQKMLKMPSYQTVWTMGQKIRQAMASRNERYALKGLVEMDDAFFGGKGRGKRGRGAAKKAKVRVMAENRDDHPGFAAMQVVDELDAETVKKTAERWISAGETIKTDQYSSFGILTRSSFQHETDPVTYPEQASVRFPWVHTVISNCKNQLKGTQRGVSRKHLHRYLSEYCYRFNRRFWENQLFDRLLTACSLSPTITYSELTG